MIEAVIFDMDGLLIDSEPLWKLAEIKVFGSVGIDLNNRSCEETVGLRIDQVVDLWFDRHPWENKTKLQVVDEIIEEMQHLIKSQGEAKKGVAYILNFFAEKNIKMAIASSSYQILIEEVIKKLNLSDRLKTYLSAEHEEYGKPHPAIFLNTAKKLNIPYQNCLVFEDSFNGILAAKSSRMKVVAVPEESHLKDVRLIIADLSIASLDQFGEKEFDQINTI